MSKSNILKLFLLISSSAIISNATTTMCFKEAHQSMATIESTPLDGGECNSKKSINDMKKEGWIVDDITIEKAENGKNFIYVLKKESNIMPHNQNRSISNEDAMMEKLYKRLDAEKKAKEIAKIEEEKKNFAAEGERIYKTKCQTCHGEKGELEAKNTSRPLNTLSEEEMQQSLIGYNNGGYDRGLGFIMQTIAGTITDDTISSVSAYLESINKK